MEQLIAQSDPFSGCNRDNWRACLWWHAGTGAECRTKPARNDNQDPVQTHK